MDKEKLIKTLKDIALCLLIYFAAFLLSLPLSLIGDGGFVLPAKIVLLCAGSVLMTRKTGGIFLCPTVSLAAGIASAFGTASAMMDLFTMGDTPTEGFEQIVALFGIIGGGVLSAVVVIALVLTSLIAFILMLLSSYIARKIFIKKGIIQSR